MSLMRFDPPRDVDRAGEEALGANRRTDAVPFTVQRRARSAPDDMVLIDERPCCEFVRRLILEDSPDDSTLTAHPGVGALALLVPVDEWSPSRHVDISPHSGGGEHRDGDESSGE